MSSGWRGGDKPLDAGTGVVCASFGAEGQWLSLGTIHPSHGFVELSGMPAIDEVDRGRPELVRRYRALMTDERQAFLTIEALAEDSARGHGWKINQSVQTTEGEASIVQEVRISSQADGGTRPTKIRVRFRGRLDRPALTMITPVGTTPPLSDAQTVLEANGPTLRVVATELAAQAEIRVEAPEESAAWFVTSGGAEMVLDWPAAASVAIRITGGLHPLDGSRQPGQPAAVPRHGRAAAAWLPPAGTIVIPAPLRPALGLIRQRALRYVVECTALRVAPDRVVILTDHRILPLSWTRDAYYQALLLLSAGRTDLVADHLRWLWLSCDRPAGTWARSHHADGRRKDEVYQADQQLYPLLELADYWRQTHRLPELEGYSDPRQAWRRLVSNLLDVLAESFSAQGLLPTDENAADDPVDLPYVLSTQILAWYTLRRLDEAHDVLELSHPLSELAERCRRGVHEHFVADGPRGRLWAYAIDGHGQRWLHQDAGDFPTVFGPIWGFCAATNPLWRRTMAFAFSPDNEAYVKGRWGGLGSRHTPGSWSLGMIQEWVAMSLAGETAAAQEALRRLVAVACSDGSLPEASDPATGRAAARHWFAWPGALVGWLLGDVH